MTTTRTTTAAWPVRRTPRSPTPSVPPRPPQRRARRALVQVTVFREAYAGRLPDEVVALFEPDAFARSWRVSLAAPPQGVHRLLVACAGDQVVGLAAVGPSQDPDAGPACGEVTVLGVHPDARRQGHGSRLRNATVDVLREAGAEAVTLWLLSDDEAARGFLGASGFAPDGAFRDRVVSPDGATLREEPPRGPPGRRRRGPRRGSVSCP